MPRRPVYTNAINYSVLAERPPILIECFPNDDGADNTNKCPQPGQTLPRSAGKKIRKREKFTFTYFRENKLQFEKSAWRSINGNTLGWKKTYKPIRGCPEMTSSWRSLNKPNNPTPSLRLMTYCCMCHQGLPKIRQTPPSP